MLLIKFLKMLRIINFHFLLSPSSASYDQYKNFAERGKEFKRLVKNYAKKILFET